MLEVQTTYTLTFPFHFLQDVRVFGFFFIIQIHEQKSLFICSISKFVVCTQTQFSRAPKLLIYYFFCKIHSVPFCFIDFVLRVHYIYSSWRIVCYSTLFVRYLHGVDSQWDFFIVSKMKTRSGVSRVCVCVYVWNIRRQSLVFTLFSVQMTQNLIFISFLPRLEDIGI